MTYIVIFRLNNEQLVILSEDDTDVFSEWKSEEAAEKAAQDHILLGKFPYEVIGVNV